MSLTADTTLVLPATAPFEFSLSAAFLDSGAPCAAGARRRDGDVVVGGFAPEPFVATLSADGPDAVRAHVDWVDAPGDGYAVADHLDARLSLSDDPAPLYETAADDETMADVVADLSGHHHVRFPTPFAAACWAALSRRAPPPVAARRRDALVRALGRVAAVDGARVSLFPTPAMVRGRPGAVGDAVVDDRSAESVLAAAAAFLATDLRERPTAALRARLEVVPEFDSHTAAFVALRGFGRTATLPAEEPRLRTAVGDAYGLADPTAEDVRRLAAPYGDSRGYWARYLRVRATLRGGRPGAEAAD
jgi:DNA-3-methyladenine glycosylase II